MKLKFTFLGIALIALMGFINLREQPRLLIFTKTSGFHHSSIPAGVAAIIKLGKENNFLVDTTSDASKITESNLKQYSALVFLNTTGDLLNHYQEADLERYM